MEGKIIVKNPNGTSKAWDRFGFYKVGSQIFKEKAVCKICFQECKYTGGTTNLNQHLQKHHSDLLTGSSDCGKKRSIQAQITTLIKKPSVKLSSSSKTYQAFTEGIAEFLFGDLIPLSVMDSKHFRGMVSLLTSGTYEPPSRWYFTNTLLPKMLKDTQDKIKTDINALHGIGLTTDAWTSIVPESYITCTAH